MDMLNLLISMFSGQVCFSNLRLTKERKEGRCCVRYREREWQKAKMVILFSIIGKQS